MSTSKETKIYACEYVMSIQIEGKPETEELYFNISLFECPSAEAAYETAVESIAVRDGDRYKNDYGDVVRVECKGINDIEVAADDWEEMKEWASGVYGHDVSSVRMGRSQSTERFVRAKDDLTIFNPPTKDKKSIF